MIIADKDVRFLPQHSFDLTAKVEHEVQRTLEVARRQGVVEPVAVLQLGKEHGTGRGLTLFLGISPRSELGLAKTDSSSKVSVLVGIPIRVLEGQKVLFDYIRGEFVAVGVDWEVIEEFRF